MIELTRKHVDTITGFIKSNYRTNRQCVSMDNIECDLFAIGVSIYKKKSVSYISLIISLFKSETDDDRLFGGEDIFVDTKIVYKNISSIMSNQIRIIDEYLKKAYDTEWGKNNAFV